MSQDGPSPQDPPSPPMRRASFAPGQKLTDMFGRSTTTTGGSSAYPGPIAAAAANAHAQHKRRMSISTLGLSGSPNQTSPFSAGGRPRKESQSSSGSTDESAIDESADGPPVSAGAPGSPFARRLSFGARAMRDARSGSGGGVGSFSNGEGFNWSDNLRSRAERSASISSPVAATPGSARFPPKAHSAAPAEAPIREMPKQPRAPDHFQERILKGDFYMD